MEKVSVHGVGLFIGSLNIDAVLFAIRNHFGTPWELLTERIIPPRCNHFDVGSESIEREFKANLVISLSGSAVCDSVGSFGTRHVEHALNDARTSDRGSKKVAAFVNGVGLKHRVNIVAGEFLFEITDVALGRASAEGFFFESVKFFGLSDICAVGNNFGIVFLFEPKEKNGGVKTTRVCDDDFHRGLDKAEKRDLRKFFFVMELRYRKVG